MDETTLRRLLFEVTTGETSADDAVRRLKRLPFADLGIAKVDHHRVLRQGLPEAVYGPGKSPEHAAAVVAELLSEPAGGPVLLTRATPDQVGAALELSPGGKEYASGSPHLQTVVWRPGHPKDGRVVVITAGTADLPVATEALVTLEAYGYSPDLYADCGVAGIHRLFSHQDALMEADAVIVVAGMEGALASVVGGLTPAAVVAVPTSVGYGAGLEGVTALLGMLASCAAGLSVVGIDNGFGAACAVARALR